ncbi:MAG: hypothetical protein OK452_09050 [Thaumarchaeota archaeon]|nr:hypothetical protein [Nitrososphaerota archaeon]
MSSDELRRISEKLEEHERRILELEKRQLSSPRPMKKELSIKEFILGKQPRSDVQRTLVVGLYLEQHRALTSLNVKDLEDGFREAKEIIPKNINLAVIGNIGNGHMMEAKEKKDDMKAWTLTNRGVEFVEKGFKEQ